MKAYNKPAQSACFIAVLALACLVLPAAAADRWWDGGSTDITTNGDGGSAGGAGTWNLSLTNWDQGSGLSHVPWNNANNDNAIFGGATAGAVTLTTNITVNAVMIANTAGTYTLSGTNITFAGTAPSVSVTRAGNINCPLSGTVGLTKVGGAVLTMAGSVASDFTGGFNLAAGSVTMDFVNLPTPTDMINGGNALSFTGGTLTVKGKNNSGVTSQTLGNVSVNNSYAQLLVNPNGAANTTSLTLGTLTNNMIAGSGMLLAGMAASSTGTLNLTTPNAKDATGIYGPRVLYTSDGGTTVDWATSTGSGPYVLGAYTGYATMADDGSTDSANTSASSLTTSISQTHNSLKLTSGSTLTLGAGTTLTLTGGGLLSVGTVASTITGGTLTAGNGGNSGGYNPYELVINSINSVGTTISSVIGDNAGNPVSLTINGSANGNGPTRPLTLGNVNTYTGTTTVNGNSSVGNDIVTIIGPRLKNTGTASTFGSAGDLILNGAIIKVGGADSCNRNVTLAGNSGFHVQGSTVTLSGNISGTGNLSVDGNAGGWLVLAGSNTFSGDVLFQTDGQIRLGSPYALSQANLNLTGQRIAADFTTSNLSYVIGGLKGSCCNINLGTGLGGGGSGAVSIGNNNQNGAYSGILSGTAGLTKIGTGIQTLYSTNTYTGATKINAGTVRLQSVPDLALACTAGGTGNKTITGLSNTATMFIGQAVSGVNIVSGAMIASIDSASQVTLNLSGSTAGATTATFAGHAGAIGSSTNVIVGSGGVLDVSSLSGGLTLNASQTLGGNGTVLGDVSVVNSSIVSPGASVGTLTNSGNVTWQGGGTYKWEISSTNVGGQDFNLITGVLTNQATSGNKFKINVASLNGSGLPGAMAGGFNPNVDQSWKLATASGGVVGFSGDAFSFIDGFTTYNGGSGTFAVTNIGNDILLVYKTAFVATPPNAGTANPANVVAWVGDNVTFAITPTGTGPLTNQWRLNGTNIPGATGTSLTLTNLQVAQSGNYDCVVSSPYPPASTSSVALLAVNRLVANASYRLGENGVGANNLPLDSSGSGHNFVGQSSGANVVVSTIEPAPGSTNCYLFDGTCGFSGIGWNPPEDNVGVECWVRVADLTQTGKDIFGTGRLSLGSQGGGLVIGFDASTGLNAQIPQTGYTITVGTPYLPGNNSEWVHVALVRASGQTTFYINGLPSGASSSTAPLDSITPYMGMANANGFFNGAIDEARIFTFATGQFQMSDLGYYQGATAIAAVHPKPSFNTNNTSTFDLNAEDFVTYTGWWDLWYRYRGTLPFGTGVSVAQVENSPPNTLAFPDKVFTLDPVDAAPDSGHPTTVAGIYYGSSYYQSASSTFEYGFARNVTNIAFYTGNAFSTDVLHLLANVSNTRDGSLPSWNSGHPDVLSMSVSMGFAGDDNSIRGLDYLIDVKNVLACAAMPGSSEGPYNGTLSGNLWNALSIGMNGPHDSYWNGAQYENINGNRVKPDLTTSDHVGGRTGGASSWGTPTVAGAAAFLIEAARSTNITAHATNNFVLKSILMAGASKSGLVTPVWDYNGTTVVSWDLTTPYTYSNNPPSQPLDRMFGAGLFNINNSFTILTAGEQSAVATNQPIGWVCGTNLNSTAAQTYWFAVTNPSPEFVAMMVWNRHIQDSQSNPGASYDWYCNDLKLELYNAANQLLGSSDDAGNNVEQVYLPQGLGAGLYYLKASSHSLTNENFGLAWRTACPTAVPVETSVAAQINGTIKVAFQGVPVQPYKLFRCTDLTSGVWTQVGGGTSDTNGVIQLTDPAPPADGAFYRAQFTY